MNKQHKFDDDVCIGIVKINGSWRYFYGYDFEFLLDWIKYFGEDHLSHGKHKRVGAEVVDKDNFELWAKSLEGELTFEELTSAKYEDGEQVKLTYFIDFDRQLWVGYAWFQDQSPLEDYQPEGWIGIEDNIFHYLPATIAQIWNNPLENLSPDQQVLTPLIFYREPSPYERLVSGSYYYLVSPGTQLGTSDTFGTGLFYSEKLATKIAIIRIDEDQREVIYEKTLPDMADFVAQHRNIDIWVEWEISDERLFKAVIELRTLRGERVHSIDTFTYPLD